MTDSFVSVIIPHWSAVPGADEMLEICLKSLRGADEVLVIENDGTGFSVNVNLGLRQARGTHLCVVNNDTEMIAGNLKQMAAITHGVTVPKITPEPRDHNPRAFFCMPRWVYETVGEYDERFVKGYFEDDDYIHRLELEGVPIIYTPDLAIVKHLNGGGLSMKFAGEREYFVRNKIMYDAKWD